MKLFRRMGHLRNRAAFTLIEVTIAMAMVAVISSAVVFTALGKIAEAKIQRTQSEVATLEKGVASWVYRTGKTAYHTGTAAVLTLTDMVAQNAVPSALGGAAVDPYGGAYDVQGTGANSFDISVAGVPDQLTADAVSAPFTTRATSSYDAVAKKLRLSFNQ